MHDEEQNFPVAELDVIHLIPGGYITTTINEWNRLSKGVFKKVDHPVNKRSPKETIDITRLYRDTIFVLKT
jgi:hypothetical protein